MKTYRHILIILFPIISLAGISLSHATPHPFVSTKYNGPRDGDAITRHPITYSDTVSPGYDCLWDLSQSTDDGNSYKLSTRLVNDSLLRYSTTGQKSVIYYDSQNDTVTLAGFESRLWQVYYHTPEVWLPATNLNFGSGITGIIRGRGVYSDRLRYSIAGTYTLTADARGTLIMPEGDTIRNVLRVHTQRKILHRYFTMDSTLCDITLCDITDTELAQASSTGDILIHDTRRWYAPGYRYPVLETQTLSKPIATTPLSHQACYTTVNELEQLPSDPDNQELRELARQSIEKYHDSNNDINNPTDNKTNGGEDIRYQFSQNRGDRSVSVDYTVSQPSDVEFILADVTGIVYSTDTHHCAPDEEYTVTIPYGHLPHSGPYVLYICTDSNRYAEKFYK